MGGQLLLGEEDQKLCGNIGYGALHAVQSVHQLSAQHASGFDFELLN